MDNLGKSIGGRSSRDHNRVLLVNHLNRALGNTTLGLTIKGALCCQISVANVWIGKARATMRLKQQTFSLQYIHILADCNLCYAQLLGNIGNTDKAVLLELLEDILMAFCNTKHLLNLFEPTFYYQISCLRVARPT